MTEPAKIEPAKIEPAKVEPSKGALPKAAPAKPAQAEGTPNSDVDALPFEKALAELETIVGRLERGDVPLEESIAIYERGEALKRRCEELLRQAEARVDKITTGANGEVTGTEPLDVQ